jgi:hypothetical protein
VRTSRTRSPEFGELRRNSGPASRPCCGRRAKEARRRGRSTPRCVSSGRYARSRKFAVLRRNSWRPVRSGSMAQAPTPLRARVGLPALPAGNWQGRDEQVGAPAVASWLTDLPSDERPFG